MAWKNGKGSLKISKTIVICRAEWTRVTCQDFWNIPALSRLVKGVLTLVCINPDNSSGFAHFWADFSCLQPTFGPLGPTASRRHPAFCAIKYSRLVLPPLILSLRRPAQLQLSRTKSGRLPFVQGPLQFTPRTLGDT